MMPGYGDSDSDTWPPFCGANGDPRESVAPVDEVEQAQNLLAEIRGQIDRAETAAFRRDWETYRLALCNAIDLAGSVFE